MYDHKQIIIVRKRHIPKNMPKTVISQHIPTIWVASITTNLTSVEEGPRWTAQDIAPLPRCSAFSPRLGYEVVLNTFVLANIPSVFIQNDVFLPEILEKIGQSMISDVCKPTFSHEKFYRVPSYKLVYPLTICSIHQA